MLEPLSVVLHGVETARLALGRPVLVCGAGPIGLIAAAAARASGAHPIVITDIEPRRLSFAETYVPQCQTYRIDPMLDNEEQARRILALFQVNIQADPLSEVRAPLSILECTGIESSVITACFVARRGGTITVIGVGKPTMHNLPFMHISLAEVSCTQRTQRTQHVTYAKVTLKNRLTWCF